MRAELVDELTRVFSALETPRPQLTNPESGCIKPPHTPARTINKNGLPPVLARPRTCGGQSGQRNLPDSLTLIGVARLVHGDGSQPVQQNQLGATMSVTLIPAQTRGMRWPGALTARRQGGIGAAGIPMEKQQPVRARKHVA